MAAELQREVAGRSFTVRELTIREVRDWALKIESGERALDPVGELALEGCSLADLAMMCNVTPDEFDTAAPSDFESLLEAARKLNPHFFRLRTALLGAARVMEIEAQQLLSQHPPESTSTA